MPGQARRLAVDWRRFAQMTPRNSEMTQWFSEGVKTAETRRFQELTPRNSEAGMRYGQSAHCNQTGMCVALPGGMATSNRLGWKVEENDHGTFDLVNRNGFEVDILGFRSTFETRDLAEQAIASEVARRDRCNARSRARHELMTGLGLVRCRNGSYE